MIEMLSGKPPWSNFSNHLAVIYHIGHSSQPPDLPTFISPEARDFLMNCLAYYLNKKKNELKEKFYINFFLKMQPN